MSSLPFAPTRDEPMTKAETDAALAQRKAERAQQDEEAKRIYDQQIASGETTRFFQDGTRQSHDASYEQKYGPGPSGWPA